MASSLKLEMHGHYNTGRVLHGSSGPVTASLHGSSSESGLRQIEGPLLDGFSPNEREIILASATSLHFADDSVLTQQGDPADRLFLLATGLARFFFLTSGGEKVNLLWLTPGDMFGGASLLTHSSRFIVSAEVVKGSDVLVWPRSVIRGLATRYPRLLENALSTASDYLVWYVASHLSLICYTARKRLAHVLLTLASGIGKKTPGGMSLDITNEQLANTANITLFTTSRLLSDWHRKGLIVKERGSILLRRPDQLLRTA